MPLVVQELQAEVTPAAPVAAAPEPAQAAPQNVLQVLARAAQRSSRLYAD